MNDGTAPMADRFDAYARLSRPEDEERLYHGFILIPIAFSIAITVCLTVAAWISGKQVAG